MCRHCPDNREVLLTGSGAGTLSLYQYHYPDKRTRVDKETGDKVNPHISIRSSVYICHLCCVPRWGWRAP